MSDKEKAIDSSIPTTILTFIGGFAALLAFYKGYGLPAFFFVVGWAVGYWWWKSVFRGSFTLPYKLKHSKWFRYGLLSPAVGSVGFAIWLLYTGFSFIIPQYDKRSVDFAFDPEFARKKYVASIVKPSDLDPEIFEMDVWKRWLALGVDVNDGQQLLVIQSVPFDSAYQTFDVDLQSVADCYAIDGCCFLVSGDGKWSRPLYRQVRFTAGTKETLARITIRDPAKQEYVLVFARFVRKSPNDKLPLSPTKYGLRMRVRS
jgi:hypothetical protein